VRPFRNSRECDALLDAHGIPGQIEVHQGIAELQVVAFTTGLGGEQHADPITEVGDGLMLGGGIDATMEDRMGDAGLGQHVVQAVEGVAEGGEDQGLARWAGAQELDQPPLLGRGADGGQPPKQRRRLRIA